MSKFAKRCLVCTNIHFSPPLDGYTMTMADLGSSKDSMEPPFSFSCDRKLWKPGLQQTQPLDCNHYTNLA